MSKNCSPYSCLSRQWILLLKLIQIDWDLGFSQKLIDNYELDQLSLGTKIKPKTVRV